uniref:Uncharacterized protein LOC111120378 n=1 Tax=Crassostrea virginica TaxID=6565 RepID=A0A8B8CLU0_CRAVI|nr:uncharacterized protein LOC111120378 [Crassostrea virginica]
MDPQYKVLDAIQCALCETPIPTMHCDICHINLCKACVGEHISDELTNHKIVSFSKLGELNKSIYPESQKCATNLIVLRADFRKNSQELKTNLIKKGEALHTEIDTIIQVMKSDIDDMDTQHIAAIDSQEDRLNHKITEITQVIQDLENLLETDDVKLVYDYTSRNDEFRNVQTQFNLTLPTFTPKKINTEEIHEQITSLLDQILTIPAKQLGGHTTIKKEHGGPIETQNASSSPSIKQLIDDAAITTEKYPDPIKIPGAVSSSPDRPLIDDQAIPTEKIDGPKKTTSSVPSNSPPDRQFFDDPRILADIKIQYGKHELNTLLCRSESEVWTCGLYDNFIRFYNLQGELLRSIEIKPGTSAWNFAVNRDNDLVFADYKKNSINIVRENEIQTLIRITGWKPLYLCSTSSGDFLVFMKSEDGKQAKVVRYSGSTEKQSIQWDDGGKPFYTPHSVKYLCENKNFDICVADYAAYAVVVISAAGKLRFRYIGQTLTSCILPRGLTTDSQGNILIADYLNNTIHIIDQTGNLLRYIDNCGLQQPCDLCVDSRDNLFVGEKNTGKVIKIHFYK